MYVNGKEICNLCGADKQELAELKALVRELIEQWDYSKDVGIDDYIEQLKQACTLANDSKEVE